MTLTTAQKVELNKRESTVAVLTLVTLSHADFASDHRMAFHPTDITSNSLVYTATWLQWTQPNAGSVQPRGQLQVWNGDGVVGALIDSVKTPIAVKVDRVLSNDLDTVLQSWPHYQWLNISYDAITATGQLSQRDFGRERWPPRVMNETEWPGANW